MVAFARLVALGAVVAAAQGIDAHATSAARTGVEEKKPTGITDITGGCLVKVNEWRKKLLSDATDYTAYSTNETTAIDTFLGNLTCATVASGNFAHLDGTTVRSGEIPTFVIATALKDDATEAEAQCDAALEVWNAGYEAFNGTTPPAYTDNTGVYANGKAAAYVSLLKETELAMHCGILNGCDTHPNTIACYFKPGGIKEGEDPVTADVWQKVQIVNKTKPALAKKDSTGLVSQINTLRTALSLEDFDPKAIALKTYTEAELKEAMDALTCAEIENGTVSPAYDKWTIAYAVKEGEATPTEADAIEQWTTGVTEFMNKIPPPYTSSQEVYKKNAATGFATIMSAGKREIECYESTGCTKAALICAVAGPVLVDQISPVSKGTWNQIQLQRGMEPIIKPVSNQDECVTAINAVRTKEGLGLTSLAVESEAGARQGPAGNTVSPPSPEHLMGITCEELKNSSVNVAGQTHTIMYATADAPADGDGNHPTCAEAVAQWEKGFDKLDNTRPPAYKATDFPYTNSDATAYVSLLTETSTKVKCYLTTGCENKKVATICTLFPAALQQGTAPISQELWDKITAQTGSSSSFDANPAAFIIGGAILALSSLF